MLENLQNLLSREGYMISPPPEETRGCTFVASRGGERIAVLAKQQKAKVNISQIQQFDEYLDMKRSSEHQFTSGWIISSSGFFNTGLTLAQTQEPSNLRLGTFSEDRLTWNYPASASHGSLPPKESEPARSRVRYFGVFTCKGGVGKTTTAAHLAGAFALQGYNVILVDLDPDKNLRKLFLQDMNDDAGDASLFIPGKGRQPGATIEVLNHDEWDEKSYPDTKIVVCDCSPVLSENPKSLVARFDYCIIPTTLNPLGVAKKADVICRTFEQIRRMNPTAKMFSLINGYDASKEVAHRNELLLELLQSSMKEYTARDPDCRFIHPNDCAIRYSAKLFYWGIHIVQRSAPELAFKETAGVSHPRTDFLKLAEYLENHTDIESLRVPNASR